MQINRLTQCILAGIGLIFTESHIVKAQSEYNVIQKKWIQYSDPSNLLYHHLTGEAFQLLKKEEIKVEKLTTPAQWQLRQKQQKEAIWDAIGRFPEKTPLNARITSVVQKEGFRIENLIYESLPGYYVTASLFIPDKIQQPAPAILFCSGHSALAYRRDVYQIPLQNLVKKGFIVLAFDPVSQGERLQYFDKEENKSLIGGSTKEHSYPAPQSFLIGQSVARYFVWDGIRGIDYLVSRPEVDAARIGVHGLSGGGTQTAYIAALDDRVAAAAPSGYITGYKRLMESVGVQDGEQNFYHGIARGIDHADFLEIRAPKPTLVMATTRDFFNITGTREVFDRVKKTYKFMGKPQNLQMVEGDYEHGYTQNIREGMYAFFQKHLSLPGSSAEEEVVLLTEAELQKTETGQLVISEKAMETMFSLNEKEAKSRLTQLEKSRENLKGHLEKAVIKAKELSGFREPVAVESAVFTGRTIKDGYVLEKYFIKGEGNYPVPYLLLLPENKISKVILYIHPDGKAAEAAGAMEMLVRKGYAVLAPDLIGTGELKTDSVFGDAQIEGISYNVWFTSVLIGRSIVGIQAADIIRLSKTAEKQFPGAEISVIAKGEMHASVLHAASFYKKISRVALLDSYSSYAEIVSNAYYKPAYVFSMVAGALQSYDLQDLAASLAPRKLLVAGRVNANGKSVNSQEDQTIALIKKGYQLSKANDQLQIVQKVGDTQLLEWIEEQ